METLPECDTDAYICVREFLHTSTWSQKPLLVQPQHVVARLKQQDLKPLPRNPLPDRALREYRKTAEVVGAPPWNLLQAKAYLEEWRDANVAGQQPDPPNLRFYFEYQLKSIAFDPMDVDAAGPALAARSSLPVRQVFAIAPTPAERSKRRAMAKGPAAPSAALKRPAAAMKRPAAAVERPAATDEVGAAAVAGEEGAEPGEEDTEGANNFGCSRCRGSQRGCTTCRRWADAGLRGYSRGPNQEVVAPA